MLGRQSRPSLDSRRTLLITRTSRSKGLRALLVFDEVFGFLPPHPANPPTKRPLVSLMKQARAFGVGVVVATQNPMDLDYRALSNAGLWCLGRLQTDADRARVLDGLAAARGVDGMAEELEHTLRKLAPRWFVVRNAHVTSAPILMQPRYAMSLLRGPMTRLEIRAARGVRDEPAGHEPVARAPHPDGPFATSERLTASDVAS